VSRCSFLYHREAERQSSDDQARSYGEGFASLEKLSPHLKKCLGHIVYITIVFVHAVDVKFGVPQKIL